MLHRPTHEKRMTLAKEKNNTHKQRTLPNDERPLKRSNGLETHFLDINGWHSFLLRRAYTAPSDMVLKALSHECGIGQRMRNEWRLTHEKRMTLT